MSTRCSCRLRPSSTIARANYDALHAESITASGEPTEYFARYKLACLQRLGLRNEGAVLDYGCGIGNLTEQLVTAFTDVHACDPSQKSLEVARRRAPAATFHASPDDLPNGRLKRSSLPACCTMFHPPSGRACWPSFMTSSRPEVGSSFSSTIR